MLFFFNVPPFGSLVFICSGSYFACLAVVIVMYVMSKRVVHYGKEDYSILYMSTIVKDTESMVKSEVTSFRIAKLIVVN